MNYYCLFILFIILLFYPPRRMYTIDIVLPNPSWRNPYESFQVICQIKYEENPSFLPFSGAPLPLSACTDALPLQAIWLFSPGGCVSGFGGIMKWLCQRKPDILVL